MIRVFRTNVQNEGDVIRLRTVFSQRYPLLQWNFDLEDHDRILRIEGEAETTGIVTSLLQEHGYTCEELQE